VGFTLQSVSPSQSRTPFGAMTLMPFLTSRAPALRTRRSRCPATPGPYSLRRSVPDSSRCARGPILSWDSVLSGYSTICCECQWPGARPETPGGMRDPRRSHAPANEAETAGVCSDSIGPTSIRRAFTRTCPRVLPTTAMSCRIAPTSSEQACDRPRPGLRAREDRAPEGTRTASS
jgi:hypothetical protein